ncbi:BRCA1-associated protein isoform X2 [Lycorma delicatula]
MAGRRERSVSKTKDDCEENTIHFVSGNPFVEVTKGVLHLYKEEDHEGGNFAQPTRTSNTICMLAVPASMSCHDLMTFMAAFHDEIRHVRIIRDGSPNQYMSLVTFRSEEAAKVFYSAFQGAPFNSLEPDQRCHLVFVSRVETVGEEPRMVPPPAHNELPTCPVCLERMDESLDVILAILCNHAFHGGCLAKWEDASCPVCRYVQTPEAVADNRCMECHAVESLWICLLCGHVGCGRYVGGHAYQHYLESQHCYCMELGNNRVWDYVGDNFVHRLLQNKGDGKLVEGPAPAGKDDEKLDSMQMEFTYLLSCQLEAQRKNYEDKLNRLEKQSVMELNELKQKTSCIVEENVNLKTTVAKLNKEKQTADKRVQQQNSKINQLQVELNEEREINRALQQNQLVFQEKLKAQEAELQDLREQLRDLMFTLEAGRQIAASEDRDDIAGGRIVVGEQPQQTGKGRHRRNRHK